jgi:hypothetical protein
LDINYFCLLGAQVSLSPSTTHPFDPPESVLTLRYRHPACGNWFFPCVLYSLNPPFRPISGILQFPVTVLLHAGPPETRTRNLFPIPFQKFAMPSVRIEVYFSFPLFSYPLVAVVSCPTHQEPTRRGHMYGSAPL